LNEGVKLRRRQQEFRVIVFVNAAEVGKIDDAKRGFAAQPDL
jgi:hypothetical protein